MKFKIWIGFFLTCLALKSVALSASLPAMWEERIKSVVAVDYITETEEERHVSTAYGVAIDTEGTIILPSAAIDVRVDPKRLHRFKAYSPGEAVGSDATYLGQDSYTGWHFVKVSKAMASHLVPITKWIAPSGTPTLGLADFAWGIGLRNKEEDFIPYLLQSHISIVESLPQQTAIAQQEVAGPGLPVFTKEGYFAGLAASSFAQTYLEFSKTDHAGAPVMLVDVEESSAILVSSEVIPMLGRRPSNVNGRPLAWLGAYGLQSLDREAATFLGQANQSSVVVSEVLEDSPAEKARMKAHDIIIAVDSIALPRFRPDRVVTDFVERNVLIHKPGDVVQFTVLRGSNRVELKVTLGDEPKLIREAERKYFDRLGLTVREFVYADAVQRRTSVKVHTGVVVSYVKSNSPVDGAGLAENDWIKEIDGMPVDTFTEATSKLSAAESDTHRKEFVLLVSRGTQTAVLRVKLR
jgi:serine protease Do